MLNNLRAELTRKGLKPEKAIEAVLGCTYKTAKSKLDGVTDFTVPEAIQVMQAYFDQEKTLGSNTYSQRTKINLRRKAMPENIENLIKEIDDIKAEIEEKRK